MSGPQLDIDSIEADVAVIDDAATEHGAALAASYRLALSAGSLCREVRQLRQALAAVRQVAVDTPLGDVQWRGRIRAALGAAGSQGQSGENPKDTPTPQDDETAWCPVTGKDCVCTGDGMCCYLHHADARSCAPGCVRPVPVTSTPEAATEPVGRHDEQCEAQVANQSGTAWTPCRCAARRLPTERQPQCARCKAGDHDAPPGMICRCLNRGCRCLTTAPSGLQRATEQQQVGKLCEVAPLVGGKVTVRLAGRCWHEGDFWHDLPVGGSDTPADPVVEYRSDPYLLTNPEGDKRELARARATIVAHNARRDAAADTPADQPEPCKRDVPARPVAVDPISPEDGKGATNEV